jgi:hypothetical protein
MSTCWSTCSLRFVDVDVLVDVLVEVRRCRRAGPTFVDVDVLIRRSSMSTCWSDVHRCRRAGPTFIDVDATRERRRDDSISRRRRRRGSAQGLPAACVPACVSPLFGGAMPDPRACARDRIWTRASDHQVKNVAQGNWPAVAEK